MPVGKSFNLYTALVPGAIGTATNQDVGGTKGENTQGFKIHGSRSTDFQQLRDGMFFGTLVAAGNYMSSTNPATVQEVAVETSGFSADRRNREAATSTSSRVTAATSSTARSRPTTGTTGSRATTSPTS